MTMRNQASSVVCVGAEEIARYMMTHLHPPTSSSLLAACRDRTGWSSDGFFGSAGVRRAHVSRQRLASVSPASDSPSSARIEKDRTEMWMTVGWADDNDAGRLFAVISAGPACPSLARLEGTGTLTS